MAPELRPRIGVWYTVLTDSLPSGRGAVRFLANLSIRSKIVGIILLTTIGALASAFTLVYSTTVRRFEAHLVSTLDVTARAVGDFSAFGLAFDDVVEAQDNLDNLRNFPNVVEAHLFDLEGNRFASFSPQGPGAPPETLLAEAAIFEGESVHIFAPVSWQGVTYGTIYLRGSTAQLDEQKRTYLLTVSTLVAGVGVLVVVFAYFLQGLISKPILHLAQQAERISDNADYSIRVHKPGQDEIGVLYDGFNNMLSQIQMRQQDLERSNRDLDQFAYVASHDLKAPLRAIATLSGWIEEDLADKLSESGKEQLELLRSRVQRMDSLIEGVLRYSRVGRMGTEGEQVDVAELLRELVEMLDPPAGFEVEISSGMPVLQTKRLRLGQVFSNLINNAIKYHHRDEGKIVVGVEEDASGFYAFFVADDGPGIPPQHHEKVFMMFQTLQPRDEVESTGLGLSLVKKLVEEEGGEVTLDSEEGHGATFRFTWPAMAPADAQATPEGEDRPS